MGKRQRLSGSVKSVTLQVPSRLAPLPERFYVRCCFAEYYDEVFEMVRNGTRLVTVTGPPGGWQSYMYLYFVHRYRADHPDATIVVGSFDDNPEGYECHVLSPRRNVEIVHRSIPNVEKDVVSFYDGQHATHLQKRGIIIYFTRFNFFWKNVMMYEPAHAVIYTPVWTLAELIDANDRLGLGLSSSTVRERHKIFGGVPAVCLSTVPDEVRIAYDALLASVQAHGRYSDLNWLLLGSAYPAKSNYPIFLQHPGRAPGKPISACTIRFASKFVSNLVAECTSGSPGAKSLRRDMNLVPELQGLVTWLDRCTRLSE